MTPAPDSSPAFPTHADVVETIRRTGLDALREIGDEELGKVVREAWINYAGENGDTKPEHLVPWEGLREYDKEADRRIGRAVTDAVSQSVRYTTLIAVSQMIALSAKMLREMEGVGAVPRAVIYEDVARVLNEAAREGLQP
jgi:hypothetical protein